MSPVGAVAQWMGRWSVPPSVESAFTATNKEGAMAILPLELSTTVGRSVSSARRNGFLEFQERFLEEIAVAVVWLYGVDFMSKLFNKRIKPQLFKSQNHLDPDTAWDFRVKDNARNVDLLPSQRFTLNALDRKALTKIKTIGAFISVVLATATAALLIPWLNKKKTEAIVRYLDKKEQRQSQLLSPNLLSKELPPGLSYMQWTSMPALSQALTLQQAPVQPQSNVLKFGLSGSELVQQLGHAVQQTDYGSLLAVDGGLAAGRIKVYGDRSPYEGAEIAVRDIGSLYFYMYSTPHLMRLVAKCLNPMMKTDVILEPKAGRSLQHNVFQRLLLASPERKAKLPDSIVKLLESNDSRALEKALGKPEVLAVLSKMPIAQEELQSAIQGSSHYVPKNLQQQLVRSWSTADNTRFMALLQQESRVYGVSDALPQVSEFFKSKSSVSTDTLNALLNQVREGQGAYQKLDAMGRKNLEVALKQAFRHSVGEERAHSSMRNQAVFRQMAQKLPASERPQFWERLDIMARQDSRDIANSMFRRNLNLGLAPGQKVLGEKSPAFQELGETLAEWLEKANARQQSLGEVSQEAIHELLADLKHYQGRGVFNNLPDGPAVTHRLIERLEKATPQDVPDILQSLSKQLDGFNPGMWTRFKNSYMGKNTLLEQVDALKSLLAPEHHAGAVDVLKAHLPAGNAASLEAMANRNVDAYSKSLLSLAKAANADAATTGLLNQYQQSLFPLLNGDKSRLFTLYTAQAEGLVQEKYRALVSGSIQNDSRLLNESLETAGRLPLHSKLYGSPKAKEKMAAQMNIWSNALLEDIRKNPASADALVKEMIAFRRTSQSGHIIARILAGGISMLGLGILVPKLQYAMTKKLTGKDEHPGIATLHHADQHTHSWHKHSDEEQSRRTFIDA